MKPRQRRGWRVLMSVASVGALIGMLIPVEVPPAYAAGGTVNVKVEAVNPEILSGEGASFRVQWNCSGSGSCDNTVIEIPVPVGDTTASPSVAFPDGIPLKVTSQSGVTGGSSSIVGTAPNQVLVWTLPPVLATGTSGTVSFTVTVPNSITPNGTTIAPVPTISADGTSSVTVNADHAVHTTVNSDFSLTARKLRLYPTDTPYVDQQVTYRILVGYDEQMPVSPAGSNYAKRMRDMCETLGVQALENLVVVDTLEPGSEFVAANHGGTYDSATHTVTWNLGSSINDAAPYGCVLTGGHYEWTAPEVTVKYPSPTFDAEPDPEAVTNTVVATAHGWGQPSETVTSSSSTSHGLRVGSPGATVAKGPGYDWAVGAPLYRGVSSANNSIYNLVGTSTDVQPAQWHFIDMMPCGFTSPQDATDTDCSTPAFINLNFSADQFLLEIDLQWTTNTGRTGICTLPAGTSVTDNTKRYCVGTTDGSQSAPGVPAGEWITKIEVDTEIPAFGGGHIHIHGTPNMTLPADNTGVTYLNPHVEGVIDRSDVHPWYVTVENCPITNTITFANGTVWDPPSPQHPSDNGGICGYRQVMTEPVNLRPVKSMYTVSPGGTPSVQPGESLTVDLAIQRSNMGPSSLYEHWTYTPTLTEYLPAHLSFNIDSLEIVPNDGSESSAALVTAFGTPHVDTEMVTVDGEPRQKVTISFPEASIAPGMQLGNPSALARFTVTVADGVPSGTYTNYYLATAAEAGPHQDGRTYLNCSTGTMVDANLSPTTDRTVAIGCLAQHQYTVLPIPGASVSKTVQGTYDDAPVRPGIGSTNLAGGTTYTIEVKNSGSVDIRNVVVYDLLPRQGDTFIIPGSSGSRDSDFPVTLTGPVTAPASATVLYSTSPNPCRGDLAGTGGGTRDSAPAGCDDLWTAIPPLGDYSAVTAIRIDFGATIFAPAHTEYVTLHAHADVLEGSNPAGVAWNNAAIVAKEASSGNSTLPTEHTPVGIQVLPDLKWDKVDADSGERLEGSEWTLTPADGSTLDGFPLTITDCDAAPCDGPDQDAHAGSFSLTGIPWGEYHLTETVAPDGYVLLEDPVLVELSATTVDSGTMTVTLADIVNERALADVIWTKVDAGDDETLLTGSEWQIVPLDAAGDPIAAEAISVTDCASSEPGACAATNDHDTVGGQFLVQGLDAGEYHLVETKAPAGFSLRTEPIPFTVTAGHLGGSIDLGSIENNKRSVPEIPLTGGLGEHAFFFAGGGGALIALALIALHALRRRHVERSAT